MKFRLINAFMLLSIASSAYATSIKYLDSYESIKNHLLKGGEIKVIIDSKTDCKLISQSGPIPYSPNTYSINAKEFIIQAKTGNIQIPVYADFNPSVSTLHMPPHYLTQDVIVSPQGEITVKEQGISLIDYNVAMSIVTSCVIGDENHVGAKFIAR
ncbi:MAG: hypothetical protein ACYCQI_12520 [Gammaproteobacteria bacterium]